MTDLLATPLSEDDEFDIVFADEQGGEEDNDALGISIPSQPEVEVEEGAQEEVADSSEEGESEAAQEEAVLPSEEADEPDDAEYKSYSVGVKKRIKREIRLRKQVAQQLELVEQQRNSIFTAAKNGEAAYLGLQKQHDALQEQYYQLLDSALQTSIEQKTSALQTAREQGDTAAEIQAQAAVEELRFNKRQLAEVATSFNTQKAQREKAQPQLQQMPFGETAPAIPLLAKQWVQRNSWIREEKYAAHREYIKQIDAKLLQMRYDPNTELYYTELDKELRRVFPSTPRPQAAPARMSQRVKSPVAPNTGANRGGASKAKRIVLTKADISSMQRFGLDPTNKAHVLAFAKERAKSVKVN